MRGIVAKLVFDGSGAGHPAALTGGHQGLYSTEAVKWGALLKRLDLVRSQ